MARHCDFCGEVLDADEEEHSDTIGKEICSDCLHDGMTLLRKVLNKG